MTKSSQRSEDEWRAVLSPDEYRVLREKGTERAFTGEYYQHNADGTYLCRACGERLFDSGTKYESGSGWPSFWAPLSGDSVALHDDSSHGMHRVEVTCASCGSHLGHVFEDGPRPTGQRFCINSISLSFEGRREETEDEG